MSLTDRYPDYWRKSTPTVQILEAIGAQTDVMRGALADLLDQCDVARAGWGLELWETQLGIVTDATKSDDFRRSVILSRLRGVGTVTAAMLENMARSFTYGEVSILEDAANFRFTVKFVSKKGVTPNLEDLTAAINLLQPAHLTWAYEFIYLLLREVSVMTVETIQTQKIDDFAF